MTDECIHQVGIPNPSPRLHDSRFDENDLMTMLWTGFWNNGPYTCQTGTVPAGPPNENNRVSVIYNAESGEISVEVPDGRFLTGLILESDNKFTGDRPPELDGPLDIFNATTIFEFSPEEPFASISFGVVAEPGLTQEDITVVAAFFTDIAPTAQDPETDTLLRSFEVRVVGGGNILLQAGDADQDLDFDQLDLIAVQIAAKYRTGQVATWGDGDWDGAPGGSQGNPPTGDGFFDQKDIIAALGAAIYLKGPYATLKPDGQSSDGQTSVVYDTTTGQLSVDSPAGKDLTSINITSAGSMFIGDKPAALDGAFDNFAADNVFKATFGGSFGSITFGNVLPAGMSEDEVAADLSAVGSLVGGGDLGEVDLVYVPEPTALSLLVLAIVGALLRQRRR